MIDSDKKYTYNDIAIAPCRVTEIEHREECNPFYNINDKKYLPIFTAPMSCVIDEKNFRVFDDNHIIPILPRNISYEIRIQYLAHGLWAAFSLVEFINIIDSGLSFMESGKICNVCVDLANGHMKKLIDSCARAKELFGDKICIMTGNIANPETYIEYCKAGIDYARCSIGTGSLCITSTQTAINYPIASLIDNIFKLKQEVEDEINFYSSNSQYKTVTKIIADGGIRNYDDIIKALALGADYVMIGGLFGKCIEASGPLRQEESSYDIHLDNIYDLTCNKTGEWYGTKVKDGEKETVYFGEFFRYMYGMASADAQIELNGKKVKTSEGTLKKFKVIYTLGKWVGNMVDYMKSAMSYLNAREINEIKGSDIIIISENAHNAINK